MSDTNLDKLTAIKIKYDDSNYSDSIPVGVFAKDVEWDQDGHTLKDTILGEIDFQSKGTVQEQLNQLFLSKVNKNEFNQYIDNLNEQVEDWLSVNIPIDTDLNTSGKAADAKAVGIRLANLNLQLSNTNNAIENVQSEIGALGTEINQLNDDLLWDDNEFNRPYIKRGTGSKANIENKATSSSGDSSHAEGIQTKASGDASHAEGYNTVANHRSQHVFGQYNTEDSSTQTSSQRGNYIEIVGNGTLSNKSNARTLDWDGNEILKGKLTIGTSPSNDKDVTTKEYVDNLVSGHQNQISGINNQISGINDQISNINTTISGINSATSTDVNKALCPKTVTNGKVTQWQFRTSEAGGGVSDYYELENRPALRGGTGEDSILENNATFAAGNNSHAEGDQTQAYGHYSHVEGQVTRTDGIGSHAEGRQTRANGPYSHVEGFKSTTTTEAYASHAEGYDTIVSNRFGHAEGYSTKASGIYSHAEGNKTEANGTYSHAEGDTTKAYQWSHAEGKNTLADGDCSHTEGSATQASGNYSHAEGNSTTASAEGSHAEGYSTKASGFYSHAEGGYGLFNGAMPVKQINLATGTQIVRGSTAYGNYSHAEGFQTFAGGEGSHAEGCRTEAIKNYSHAEGFQTFVNRQGSHAEGGYTYVASDYSHGEGYYTKNYGQSSHAEGYGTVAHGAGSHSEGGNYDSNNEKLSPISVDFNDKHYSIQGPYALGNNSHAEGSFTFAGGHCSHAEGYLTKAFGDYSCSIGYRTRASGPYSMAAGDSTIASASCSTAMGNSTTASGYYSTAMGHHTVATEPSSTVIGRNNAATRSGSGTEADPYTYTNVGNYAFIIGNGTGDETANRSNALTVDWEGNLSTSGSISEGGVLLANKYMPQSDYSTVVINDVGYINGSFTNTGATINVKYCKFKDIVTVSGEFHTGTNIVNSSVNISEMFRIPQGFEPNVRIYIEAYADNGATPQTWYAEGIWVQTNWSLSANKTYTFCVSYCH